MGLLSGQEQTIKKGSKIAYDSIWDKCVKIQSLFSYHTAELIAGKDAPYFRITNARKGFEIQDYISDDCLDALEWGWNDITRVIPSWVQFKVKPNAYAKKYGYKPYVSLRADKHKNIVFDNGKKVKEFSNCIVIIKEYSTSIHSPIYVPF